MRSFGSIFLGLATMVPFILLPNYFFVDAPSIFKLMLQLGLATLIYLVVTTQLDPQLFEPVQRWRSKIFRA